MKAAFYRETGAPEVIQYGDVPDPIAKTNEVLVRIRASTVNPIDTYIRNGANYWPLPNPFVPGVISQEKWSRFGSEVRDLVVGQRVWGSNQGLMGRQGTGGRIRVDRFELGISNSRWSLV